MAHDVMYCSCGESSDFSRFMIECDICKTCFHGRCVGVREYQAVDIDRFHCPRCEPYHGPSVLKARLNWHRHDYSEADAANKAVQTGTQVFIKELRGRHFHSGEKVISRLQGSELNLAYIAGGDAGGGGGEKGGGGEDGVTAGGFSQPILVSDKTGLDLNIPHPSFSVEDVENYVGPLHEVDVVDVQRQEDVKMRLQEFIEYFLSPARTTVLNLISLEFSRTSLSQLVEPPMIVRKLCWVHSAWPSDPPPPPPLQRPTVSKYCLIGVENSYTDFHIDFGGSSVWYHVLWGEKIFYLIKPTPANMVLYQNWMKAANKSEMFFGDHVDACYKCEVKAGETLFLPSGWIHAVFTPTDTLVFGGNFLHSYCIDLQLKIFEMEHGMCIGTKWQFPHYQELCWYAARHLLEQLRTSCLAPPASLLHGVRVLYNALRQWVHQGGRGGGAAAKVPDGVSASKLLKELQRELRSTEKQAVALNPPRPERESKRRKKKHLADDFVDYTNLTSFHTALEERLPKRENEEYDSDTQEDKHSVDQDMKEEPLGQQRQQQPPKTEPPSLLPLGPDQKYLTNSHQLTEQQSLQDQHPSHILPHNNISHPNLMQREQDEQQQQQQEQLQLHHQQQQQQHQQQQQQQQGEVIRLSIPRPTSSYPYGLLGSGDYGMSGTPPHDPDYPAYQPDYPSNVKSDYEWSESPGVTPYRLARGGVVAVSQQEGGHATPTTRTYHATSLRMRIGRQSVEGGSAITNGGDGSGVAAGCTTTAPSTITGGSGHSELFGQQQAFQTTGPAEGGAAEDPYGGGAAEEEDDDTAGSLMIDESPVSRRRTARARQQQLKMKLAFSPTGVVETDVSDGHDMVYGGSAVEVTGDVEVAVPSAHHNGIEELLRASAYAPADFITSSTGGAGTPTATVVVVNNNINSPAGTTVLVNNANHHTVLGAGVTYHQLHQQNTQITTYRTMDEIDGSGRASPSTRDAIAGMLSMSRDPGSHYSPAAGNSSSASGRRQLLTHGRGGASVLQHNHGVSGAAGGGVLPHYNRARQHPAVATVLGGKTAVPRRYLEEESIKKVHQDEDYVYPTLDHSDDEDYPIFKPRGKKKEDEAWNPKARVRVQGPRPERPARVGVKKQAVEKGLEVAANRRNAQPVAKRAYHRKKARAGAAVSASSLPPGTHPAPLPPLVGGTGLHPLPSAIGGSTTTFHHHPSATSSHHHLHHLGNSSLSSSGPGSGSSGGSSSHASSHSTTTTTVHHRPKKGMATAKQRLGKILKIHKMIY